MKATNAMRVVKKAGESQLRVHSFRLAVLPLARILTNRFQPESRTSDGALSEIKKRVKKETQLIVPPVVVESGGRYVMIDGERRRCTALALGVTHMQCLIVAGEVNPGITFCHLNAVTRIMRGGDWMQIWAKASTKAEREQHLKTLSTASRTRIKRIASIVGDADLLVIVKALGPSFSPTIISWVDALLAMFRERGIIYDQKKVTIWAIKYTSGAQLKRVNMLSSDRLGRALKEAQLAIAEDRKPSWKFPKVCR